MNAVTTEKLNEISAQLRKMLEHSLQDPLSPEQAELLQEAAWSLVRYLVPHIPEEQFAREMEVIVQSDGLMSMTVHGETSRYLQENGFAGLLGMVGVELEGTHEYSNN
jgi:hypothetical protein